MNSIYVVTDHPDTLFEQATAAGAEVVRELCDEDYGSRGFTVRDRRATSELRHVRRRLRS